MKRKPKRNLKRFFNNPQLIKECLGITKKYYRPYDPGWYLYREIAAVTNPEERFTDDFIILTYATLIAWNMNSRAAKLAEFNVFRDSILSQSKRFNRLSSLRLELLTDNEMEAIRSGDGKALFSELNLVADSKPRLVTYSKTLHFFLPNLFVPVDRKYTLNYFHGHFNISRKVSLQFDKLSSILEESRRLAQSTDLAQFIDNERGWNANIPKIIDNIIIGYMKRRGA